MQQLKTTSRKIYFYRIHAGLKPCGEPLPFDFEETLNAVRKRINSSHEDRYINIPGTTDVLRCAIDEISTQQAQLRIGRIRKEGLPRQECDGEITDLNLAENAGLIEESHIIFFPQNIIGVESNFHAPRINNLLKFLPKPPPDLNMETYEFRQLVSDSVLNKLDELETLTLFQLKIYPSYIEEIKKIDQGIGAALETTANIGNAKQVEIIIQSAPKDRHDSLETGLFKRIKKIRSLSNNIHESASRFFVQGKSHKTQKQQKIDLLQDKLVYASKIARQGNRSKALISTDVYFAINEARDELNDALLRAAAIALNYHTEDQDNG